MSTILSREFDQKLNLFTAAEKEVKVERWYVPFLLELLLFVGEVLYAILNSGGAFTGEWASLALIIVWYLFGICLIFVQYWFNICSMFVRYWFDICWCGLFQRWQSLILVVGLFHRGVRFTLFDSSRWRQQISSSWTDQCEKEKVFFCQKERWPDVQLYIELCFAKFWLRPACSSLHKHHSPTPFFPISPNHPSIPICQELLFGEHQHVKLFRMGGISFLPVVNTTSK